MPTIYDNQEKILTKGLNEALGTSKRAYFCSGYFNRHGWKEVSVSTDALCGDIIFEGRGGADEKMRYYSLLIGIQAAPQELIQNHYLGDTNYQIDQGELVKLKKQNAEDFARQLQIGAPSNIKMEIDAIDCVLAKHYSFTDKEPDFIINYDIKHLMDEELGGAVEGEE